LAKPFVSTAFGCVVYLLAVGGVLMMLKGDAATTKEILAALSFFAAFSDRFALSVLDRLLLPPSATHTPRTTPGRTLIVSDFE
jgi:hypothetical protein